MASLLVRKLQFTYSFLQQLLQAVDVWSVSSLPLHHHAVAAAGKHRRGKLCLKVRDECAEAKACHYREEFTVKEVSLTKAELMF